MVVDDPNGVGVSSKSITVGNFLANTIVLVDDRMQVANTTLLVNDRMQVANTVTLVNDRMQVANTTLLVNDRMQIANAVAYFSAIGHGHANYADIDNGVFTTSVSTPSLLVTTQSADPATSDAAAEGIAVGTMFYSTTYLYIATGVNTIKRVALSTF